MNINEEIHRSDWLRDKLPSSPAGYAGDSTTDGGSSRDVRSRNLSLAARRARTPSRNLGFPLRFFVLGTGRLIFVLRVFDLHINGFWDLSFF